MVKQRNSLIRLELTNIYGINIFRYTKDKKAKNRYTMLGFVWLLLLCMLFFYVGGLSYGLIRLNMADIIPAYLIMIASLLLFAFGIFKAGSMIFSAKNYDSLSSLPISQGSIVVSRFIRMYVEDLVLALVVMFPGIAVYGFFIKPGFTAYLLSLLVIIVVPLLPLVASTIIGAVITGISARMRHKTMTQTILTLGFILILLVGSFSMEQFEGGISEEMLKNLAAMVKELIGNSYPPAVWLGDAIIGNGMLGLLLYLVVSGSVFSGMLFFITKYFHGICSRLFETSAKHNYKMQTLKGKSVLGTLYTRELKRYFASSIYVTNTIIGPIMGTLLSAAILVVGIEKVQNSIQIPFAVKDFLPFVLAGVFTIMTTTCTSISMEGKQFWIIKSLPVSTKAILDSKILMNLSLIAPFFLVSEILLIIATKPTLLDLLWLILIPTALILFACVIGISVNLVFCNLNWEKEEYVVKQSASSMLGGFAGMLLSILVALPFVFLPVDFIQYGRAIICLLVFSVTALLYYFNNRKQLQDYN